MRYDQVSSSSNQMVQILSQVHPSRPFLLRIEGKSMLPLIPTGTAVEVEPLAGCPRIGDVVVRIDGSTAIVHRVICQRRSWESKRFAVVTKGDNTLRLDLPCDATEVVGIVRRIWKVDADGKIRPRRLPRPSGLWIARLLNWSI
ncbi:S24/S26 family peptidase [bacterium]|nr:S24/S26 family peptidase [bacterium]